MKKKLVCLSSGATAQYRLDILRVMALPEGAEIQFRYDIELVDAAVRAGLGQDKLHGSSVLLAYLDLSESSDVPGVRLAHPCRIGKLIDSEKLGQFVILRFRLGEFSACADIGSFRAQLASKSPQAKDGDLRGFWVFQDDFDKFCKRSTDMTVWQTIMSNLGQSSDFASEDFFFRVMGLYRRGVKNAIKPWDGEYKLNSSSEYEWRVFHFHPQSDDHKLKSSSTVIEVASASEDIKPVTTPTLAINSSYDLKSFHFRTNPMTVTTYSAFTVKFEDTGQVEGDATALSKFPELYLPVKIVTSWIRSIASVVFLTVLLFGQQYISASSKGDVHLETAAALLTLAFLTALLVVYGLKKAFSKFQTRDER